MKKLLGILGLLFGLGAVAFAGTPQEQPLPGQNSYSHKTVFLSTASFPTAGNQTTLTMTQAPGTINDGGATSTCRNCFTRFFVQIPTNTIVNVLDGGTTVYAIDGLGLASSGVNTLSLPEEHLGPACFTAGNTTTISTQFFAGAGAGAGVAVTQPTSITAEGYIQCGHSNQGGLMQ